MKLFVRAGKRKWEGLESFDKTEQVQETKNKDEEWKCELQKEHCSKGSEFIFLLTIVCIGLRYLCMYVCNCFFFAQKAFNSLDKGLFHSCVSINDFDLWKYINFYCATFEWLALIF